MAGAQRAEVGQCGAGGGGGGAPAVPGLQSTLATLATLVLAPCHGYTLLPTAESCQHPGITLAMLILYYKRIEM